MKECQGRSKKKASGESDGKSRSLICITPIATHFAIRVLEPREVIMLNVL